MTNSRRAREMARQRAERQAARRAAARQQRRRRIVISLVTIVALGAATGIGFGVDAAVSGGHKAGTSTLSAKSSASPSPSASPSAASSPAGTPICDYTKSPAGPDTKYVGLPPDRKATDSPVAHVVTNRGTLTIALNAAKAPCTVNSFEFLAAKNYFTNTPCHRLTTSGGLFVLQCGDPTGTGQGGPGYTIPDENLTGATYPAGTVAMANTGQPHTGGSQFFIVYKNSTLPPQYTPFGTVTAGLNVILGVAAKGATPVGDGKPNDSVMIERFTITG
ncbi:MAG: peptidylprolyl isomerase [Mycobacteriales bacterium]